MAVPWQVCPRIDLALTERARVATVRPARSPRRRRHAGLSNRTGPALGGRTWVSRSWVPPLLGSDVRASRRCHLHGTWRAPPRQALEILD